MFLQNLFQVIRTVMSIALLIVASYCFLMSITETYRNFDGSDMTKKAASLRFRYLCGAAICGFLAFEIYVPDVICVPFLIFLIGAFWFEYLINLGVISLRKK
jgi:hypothetical protein